MMNISAIIFCEYEKQIMRNIILQIWIKQDLLCREKGR